MKRLSCSGCEYCGFLDEYMPEDIYDGGGVRFEDKFIPGKLYEYKVICYSRDWESGIVDDVETGFVLRNNL